ncbi:hypothetical protein BjapCC829_06920 [Bradyrhizobium barranii]|uniref:Uncharacterized protein n=1 Tax=Bradyrhizobium barranii TaxID=2992140 RepID=A0ABY3QZL7_9BRAD|nr:hypothetical protein [Bradyrhizobium japonicum]UFW91503.1 hypothetical protein BjapCC829_06920 [Bradyrhizobium japonicum]
MFNTSVISAGVAVSKPQHAFVDSTTIADSVMTTNIRIQQEKRVSSYQFFERLAAITDELRSGISNYGGKSDKER